MASVRSEGLSTESVLWDAIADIRNNLESALAVVRQAESVVRQAESVLQPAATSHSAASEPSGVSLQDNQTLAKVGHGGAGLGRGLERVAVSPAFAEPCGGELPSMPRVVVAEPKRVKSADSAMGLCRSSTKDSATSKFRPKPALRFQGRDLFKGRSAGASISGSVRRDSTSGDMLQKWFTVTRKLTKAGDNNIPTYEHFETMSSVAVVLQLIWLGFVEDAQFDNRIIISIEVLFAVFFSGEELFKMQAVGLRRYLCGSSMWGNLLCTLMNTQSWAEVGLQAVIIYYGDRKGNASEWQVARVGRAIRVLRLARVLRARRILKKLLDVALGGIGTFIWSVCVVAVLIYVVALFYRALLGNETSVGAADEEKLFSSVPVAYYTSFRCFISNECFDANGQPIILGVVQRRGWALGAFHCLMSMFFSWALFNVVVAVFVDNSMAAAKRREAEAIRTRLTNFEVYESKVMLLVSIVLEHTGRDRCGVELDELWRVSLTHEDFDDMLENPEFTKILRELDIADEDHHGLFKTLDGDCSGTVDLEDLVGGLSMLRGTARRSDVIGISLRVQYTLDLLTALAVHIDPDGIGQTLAGVTTDRDSRAAYEAEAQDWA